jgi:hypothetical protein
MAAGLTEADANGCLDGIRQGVFPLVLLSETKVSLPRSFALSLSGRPLLTSDAASKLVWFENAGHGGCPLRVHAVCRPPPVFAL